MHDNTEEKFSRSSINFMSGYSYRDWDSLYFRSTKFLNVSAGIIVELIYFRCINDWFQANVCNTKNTPFIVTAAGLYDVDYKIIIATRENQVCLLKRGWLEGKSIIHINKTIMDVIFVPGDNVIVLATTDKMLHTYTRKVRFH